MILRRNRTQGKPSLTLNHGKCELLIKDRSRVGKGIDKGNSGTRVERVEPEIDRNLDEITCGDYINREMGSAQV